MFKNYLTQHLASALERECRVAEDLTAKDKHELMRCSAQMLSHFLKSQQLTVPEERAQALFVAINYLQDCQELVRRMAGDRFGLLGRIAVLEGRFAQLFEETAKAENGQLRMLG